MEEIFELVLQTIAMNLDIKAMVKTNSTTVPMKAVKRAAVIVIVIKENVNSVAQLGANVVGFVVFAWHLWASVFVAVVVYDCLPMDSLKF